MTLQQFPVERKFPEALFLFLALSTEFRVHVLCEPGAFPVFLAMDFNPPSSKSVGNFASHVAREARSESGSGPTQMHVHLGRKYLKRRLKLCPSHQILILKHNVR